MYIPHTYTQINTSTVSQQPQIKHRHVYGVVESRNEVAQLPGKTPGMIVRNTSVCVDTSLHTAPPSTTVALNRRRLREGEYK